MEQNQINQKVLVAVPQLTRQDFFDHIADMWQYTWPDGAIECINPENTKLVYLWGNRFKGTAEGSWTAKMGCSHTIEVNKKKVQIAEGTPYTGSLPQIDFDLLVINDNQEIPYWAKDFCTIGFCANNFQTESYVSASGGVIEGHYLGSSHSAWMKNGNEIIDNFLLPIADDLSKDGAIVYLALDILPAEVVQHSLNMFSKIKFSSRDVKVSSRNSVKEEPELVLIPFYILEFQFEGKNYNMAVMADKQGTFKGTLPVKNDALKTADQIVAEEMPDKLKQAKIIKWCYLLAIVLWFVANFTIAVGYLIVWGIGYWFFKKPIRDRIKKLDKQKADGQQRAKELLKMKFKR